VHQQCSWRRCFLSQNALQWFEVLPGMSPALPGAPRLVVSAPWYSPGCHQTSYVHPDFSPVPSGAPACHCMGLVHSRIWLPWDSGPTTPRGSQRQKYILLIYGLFDPTVMQCGTRNAPADIQGNINSTIPEGLDDVTSTLFDEVLRYS